jgi:hypothetical protein
MPTMKTPSTPPDLASLAGTWKIYIVVAFFFLFFILIDVAEFIFRGYLETQALPTLEKNERVGYLLMIFGIPSSLLISIIVVTIVSKIILSYKYGKDCATEVLVRLKLK